MIDSVLLDPLHGRAVCRRAGIHDPCTDDHAARGLEGFRGAFLRGDRRFARRIVSRIRDRGVYVLGNAGGQPHWNYCIHEHSSSFHSPGLLCRVDTQSMASPHWESVSRARADTLTRWRAETTGRRAMGLLETRGTAISARR